MTRCMTPFLALVVAVVSAAAQPSDTASTTTISIWGGTAPGSENAQRAQNFDIYNSQGDRFFWNIAHPVLAAFYAVKPNGAAVLIIPGGGYSVVYADAMAPVARWFNGLGIDAFVLTYRLPDEGHAAGYSVPLQDAQRSLRLIRSGAFSHGHTTDRSRIGVIGFSAGGNLAAVLGLYHASKVYEPRDPADSLSARPDFMILAYPVLPEPGEVQDNPWRSNMVRLYRTYQLRGDALAGAPPAFLMHGDADRDVPYTQSVRFARVLEAQGVPVELRVFHGVGHSFALGAKGEAKSWPDLCAAWLRARAIIP